MFSITKATTKTKFKKKTTILRIFRLTIVSKSTLNCPDARSGGGGSVGKPKNPFKIVFCRDQTELKAKRTMSKIHKDSVVMNPSKGWAHVALAFSQLDTRFAALWCPLWSAVKCVSSLLAFQSQSKFFWSTF